MAAKKKAAKKPAKKKSARKTAKKVTKKTAKPKVKKEKKLGEVEHYFGKIMVAAVKMKAPMKVGDIIHIKGHTTDFDQKVVSIQIEHESVQKVKKGDDIGIKVKDHAREGDTVFLKNLN
jgi:hypothetical protein